MTYQEGIKNFTLEQNRHKYAVWCAATAASTSTRRFSVEEAYEWIKEADLKSIGSSWEALPSAENFDSVHLKIRNKLICNISVNSLEAENCHGIAAKLINIYLKTIFVVGASIEAVSLSKEKQAKLNAIHPPLDRTILREIKDRFKKCKKAQTPTKTWSKLKSCEYQDIINTAKEITGGEMWRLEALWPGHQQT